MQIVITIAADGHNADESLPERAALAREIYAKVENGTESFEVDHLGADLAYLLGAILRGDSGCEWDDDRPFVRLLHDFFDDEHPVWQYVDTSAADSQEVVA